MKKILVLFYIIFLLSSCQKDIKKLIPKKDEVNENITKSKKEIIAKKRQSIKLDVFTKLPSEIDGSGGCLFFLSKADMQAKKYLCVNNLANLAYISINGSVIEFKLIKYEEQNDIYFYSNKDTFLKIIVEKNKSIDDETSNIEGEIVVERGVEIINMKFIGICGF